MLCVIICVVLLTTISQFSEISYTEPDNTVTMNQKVDRPSLPDFPYANGYQSGITHFLKDNGIFWSVVSRRTHTNKRDTEGDIVALEDGSLLLAWSDFYTEGMV